jgi:hypothetical protein
LIPDNPASKEPNVLQILQHCTAVVLELLHNRLYSPGSPEQLIIEQLYKSIKIANTNKFLIAANTRPTRKQAKKRSYIVFRSVLSKEERAILAKEKSNPKPRKKPNKVTKNRNNRQSTVQSTKGFFN